MMKQSQPSTLIISLDFELHWGMFDKFKIEEYEDELLGAREAIPKTLDLFNQYDVHATWATVGLLFFQSLREMNMWLPDRRPNYDNVDLSAYHYLANNQIGPNEEMDLYHFGFSLVKLICSYPNQEIGSHTFSHYYCLEPGQTADDFYADMQTSVNIAEAHGIDIKSLVFPRNQCNQAYLDVCKQFGVTSYRGTEKSWLYQPRGAEDESLARRIIRLIDQYVNLSSHHCYSWDSLKDSWPINIPSSRFLRAYSNQRAIFEPLRLRRILKDIEYAAKTGSIYHLWWHPQDFGRNTAKNLEFLEQILQTYQRMQKEHGMQSLTMREAAQIMLPEAVGQPLP